MHCLKSQPIFSEDSQTERREPFDFPTRISSFLCQWKVFLVTCMNTDLERVKQRWRRRQQERQKSILLIYIGRQQLCSCITLLCTFVYWPCTTKSTWNFLIPRFNRTWTKDNDFTLAQILSFRIQLRKNSSKLDKLNEMESEAMKFETAQAPFIIQWRFCCRCRNGCLSFLFEPNHSQGDFSPWSRSV